MKKKPYLGLIIALMMFPQVVETIYSPVLPHLASAFSVTMGAASQTLSVYFSAFALGVVFWGRMADISGRRRTMLAGLLIYGAGSVLAILADNFSTILVARIISAFGAAVGSVVTQTMLRDSYEGPELGRVFSIMGMGISISPVVGLISGGLLAHLHGYMAVFTALAMLAVIMLFWSVMHLPETKPESADTIALIPLIIKMLSDRTILINATLVALFNLMLFSYYSLAPFIFSRLNLSSVEFGYSGVFLATGALSGSALNKKLIKKGYTPEKLTLLASGIAIIGSALVYGLQDNIWFVLPMILIVMSYGIALPNILSTALVNYKSCPGSAGALLGLMYYLMLSAALGLAGWLQSLGIVLMIAAILSTILSITLGAKTHPTP